MKCPKCGNKANFDGKNLEWWCECGWILKIGNNKILGDYT